MLMSTHFINGEEYEIFQYTAYLKFAVMRL